MSSLEWTGEQVIPEEMWRDPRDLIAHLSRYIFCLRYCQNKVVLDCASGAGYGTMMLSWVASQVTGVDINSDCITYAEAHYATPRNMFVKGDARKLPADNGTMDCVVSFETIEHMLRPEEFMAEIYRVLKPEGMLICSAPENSGSIHHVAEYSAGALEDLLLGFKRREYFVQDVGREMEIRPNELPTSEHPTHIFVCIK